MKKMMRSAAAAAAAVGLSLSFAVTGFAAVGWEQKDGKWYYYDSNENMVAEQWVKSGSKLYWFAADGVMAMDMWVTVGDNSYYMSASGPAMTGWNEINEKWYYFDKDTCIMATDETINGWYVGKDGAWVPGK